MSRPLPSLAATALACGLLAACGGSSSADHTNDAAGDGWPVTLDNCDRKVDVQAEPERIVSLNQGSTEILLSLGLADRMVGTAGWTDPILPSLEAENDTVERLADQAPSYEDLLATEPDLVTASFTGTLGPGGVTTFEQLEELGVPSYLSAAECGKTEAGNTDGARDGTLEVEAIFTEVSDLATLTGERARGEEVVAELQDRFDTADETDAEGISALYWFANAESPYMAGCCGGPGIVNRALGLENVFDDTQDEWPQIGWETVADRDPDVIVLGDLTRKSQTAETAEAKIDFLESNPATREMTAVRQKRYIALAGAELNPSIRIVDAVEKVADGLRDLGLVD
ncbi:ABC transporter substrate-binding protein [Aeromicrobium sp. CTD01-1L150]|uniref:ABC transporter substrate-binding protein n=1 Tax=Aeromicrobium sp. CTD01-1L150 TaxID=3341830 RepID=UPI0035C0C9FB